MTHPKMHAEELEIDEKIVRQLLSSQFPQWAHLSLERVKSDGTDNAIFRLGENRCIRLPRVPWVCSQIEKEQQWLPYLAPHLPLSIPHPVAKGNPDEHYPWPWSIYEWLEGENIFIKPLENLDQGALDLAMFIKALWRISPEGGFSCSRSGPLDTQQNEMQAALSSLQEEMDTKIINEIWAQSLAAPKWDKAPVWIHADLLPANLLAQEGRLCAVIDFGLFGIGDPAIDVIPAWSLFDKASRKIFRDALEIDDASWLRARGWALSIGAIILPYYKHTNRGLYAVGNRMLNEIINDV